MTPRRRGSCDSIRQRIVPTTIGTPLCQCQPANSMAIRVDGRTLRQTACGSIWKVLLDPYGKGVVVPKDYNRQAAASRATMPPRR